MLDLSIVAAILTIAVILFVTEWVRLDAVALGVVLALLLSGVLTTNEALAGFSNTAVVTITSLFIVGGAVWQTGLADEIGRRVLAIAGTNETRLLIVLMVAVATLSGFMSNTGTVAVLLPAVVMLAKKSGISPTKLLIPLSFGSMLGGAATLIGTPPNIIVNDTLQAAGLEPFGFFSFLPIGLILIAVGVIFMLTLGRYLLPNREVGNGEEDDQTATELLERYQLPDYLHRIYVPTNSLLAHQRLQDTHLRRQFHVTVLKVMRPPIVPVSITVTAQTMGYNIGHNRYNGHLRHIPIIAEASTRVSPHDTLIVEGNLENVAAAAAHWSAEVRPPKPKDVKALLGKDVGIAEVVLPPRSKLIGRTLADSRFDNKYNLRVLTILRPSETRPLDLTETRLRFGDTLLVQGRWADIHAMRSRKRDFVIVGEPETIMGPPHRDKAGFALIILIAMVVLMVWGGLAIVTISLMAALGMVFCGCLTAQEAYRAVDWRSVVLIAGMLPMSTALQKVGLIDLVANGLVSGLGQSDPRLLIAGLFVITAAFTQVLSNTATTVIVAPIALTAAQTLGVAPQALLMAVAIAASMAFATPVASPTNTLVMTAGEYAFGDYARVGAPLMMVMLAVTVLVLPWFFPL